MSGTVGRIYRVAGPLVVAEGLSKVMMYEVVRVGNEGLIGEVIAIRGDRVYIQVYEETSGLTVGERVEVTGRPLSAELGPGLVGSIYDGLQRPEKEIGSRTRSIFIKRGIYFPPLSRSVKWGYTRNREVKVGDKVEPGDVLGYVKETPLVEHRIMVPPDVRGYVKWLADDGEYVVEDTIAVVSSEGVNTEVKMYQLWPIRRPRPYLEKLNPVKPLVTGIRVIDYVFPIAKGGKAAIPGGFGTGKTVALQEI